MRCGCHNGKDQWETLREQLLFMQRSLVCIQKVKSFRGILLLSNLQLSVLILKPRAFFFLQFIRDFKYSLSCEMFSLWAQSISVILRLLSMNTQYLHCIREGILDIPKQNQGNQLQLQPLWQLDSYNHYGHMYSYNQYGQLQPLCRCCSYIHNFFTFITKMYVKTGSSPQ